MTEGRLIVLTKPGLGTGFALSSAPVYEEAGGPDAEARLRGLMADPNLAPAVLVIDESLYAELSEEFRRELERRSIPVVIQVPGPDWTAASKAHEYIVEILRRAIGYRVRLQ